MYYYIPLYLNPLKKFSECIYLFVKNPKQNEQMLCYLINSTTSKILSLRPANAQTISSKKNCV